MPTHRSNAGPDYVDQDRTSPIPIVGGGPRGGVAQVGTGVQTVQIRNVKKTFGSFTVLDGLSLNFVDDAI
ncbi:MAG: hypothetical protein JWR34_7277, partial [Mycobacterium sp.]|nr:hypothetical protein [Mycobacterium sp.]